MQFLVIVLVRYRYRFLAVGSLAGSGTRQGMGRNSFGSFLQTLKERYAVARMNATRKDFPVISDEHEINPWSIRLGSVPDSVESHGFVL